MLGERGAQRGLFEADHQYLEAVGADSFYGFLAKLRGKLFKDEDFARLYKKIGRPSVPPSLLATALLLQTYDRVSDEEAKRRADFDVCWKVALGIAIEERPFAKSTLQFFRAQLVVNEEAGTIFRKSLGLARERGFIVRNRKMRVALDTTNILGRGAVKDTYNLLGDGIVLVLRQFAKLAVETLEQSAEGRGLSSYVSGRSLKGEAELDWDNRKERTRLLRGIVADADRLLAEVREVRAGLAEGGAEDAALTKAADILSQVLLQDIERSEEGPELHDGVAKDRMPSAHDPEMRHGRKSAQKRFDGHKAQIAVDTESQLIVAVDVLAGNAPDNTGALAMVKEAEQNIDGEVAETVADCAYGDGATRKEFADAGRELFAKVPAMVNRGRFPKTDFVINLDETTCLCPAGEKGVANYSRPTEESKERTLRGFRFAVEQCAPCPLRPQCVGGQGGRSIAVHPQEALLQKARAFQQSPDFRPYKLSRQVVEHRLARLVQLGLRQARYVGRAKTLFQLIIAATVANLTLLAGHARREKDILESSNGSFRFILVLVALYSLVRRPLGPQNDQRVRPVPRIASNSTSLGSTFLPFQTAVSRPNF
ncbi:MAG TPA: IS1182 family transposase [Tepidiformaceae bacterium]|jgi:transposase